MEKSLTDTFHKNIPEPRVITCRNEATNFISFSHISKKFLISSSAKVFLSFVAWSLCSCNNWKKKVVCFSSTKFVIHSEEGLKLVTSALEALYGGQFILLTADKTKSSFNFPPPKQQHSFLRNLPPLMNLARAWENNVLNNRQHKAGKISFYSKYNLEENF